MRPPGSGRPAPRPLTLALSALLLQAACGPEPAPVADRELRDSLGLADSVRIHRFILGGRGAEEHLVPPRVEVSPGDVVQFVPVDGRIHTVYFEPEDSSGALADFLSRTGQMSSPPLLDRESRFVVTFRGAPTGSYPFRVEGPGGAVRGLVVVQAGG